MHTGTTSSKSKTEVLRIPKQKISSSSANTAPITLTDGTRITFTTKFTYLGTIVTSDLSDNEDISNRIAKATRIFGFLRSLIFGNPYLSPRIKRYFYMAINVNLLL